MTELERSERHDRIGRVVVFLAAFALYALLERGVRALEQLARLKQLEMAPEPEPAHAPALERAPVPPEVRPFRRNGRVQRVDLEIEATESGPALEARTDDTGKDK